MGISLVALLILMLGGDLLEAPPRDLASLVNPTRMLEQMQVRTDEASLIALLQARHEEKPVLDELPGPRGDTEYVKQLLAIRALEAMKSGQALTVLEEIAGEADITLADATAQAIQPLRGADYFRPSGLETLKQAAGMVPPDAGFVLVLDAARGSKTVTVADYFALFQQKMGPAMGALSPPAGLLEQGIKEAEDAIVLALSLVGNIRLDSVTVVCSSDVGTEEDVPYVCLILKGLYDPVRMARVCRGGIGEPLQIEGHAVFHEGDDPAVCLLDEHTAIICWGSGPGSRYIERVLQGMAARKDTALPAHAARAFELIAQKQARMALSGALTNAQKAMIEEAFGEELARSERTPAPAEGAQMELEALRIGLALTKVELFEGYSTADGKLTLAATCQDANAAAQLFAPLSKLEENLRQQLLANMTNIPEAHPFRALFQDVAEGARLWRTMLRDRQVVVQVEPLRLAAPMLMKLGMPTGARRAPAEAVELEEPTLVAPESR